MTILNDTLSRLVPNQSTCGCRSGLPSVFLRLLQLQYNSAGPRAVGTGKVRKHCRVNDRLQKQEDCFCVMVGRYIGPTEVANDYWSIA
jgi:hypothetical protein